MKKIPVTRAATGILLSDYPDDHFTIMRLVTVFPLWRMV